MILNTKSDFSREIWIHQVSQRHLRQFLQWHHLFNPNFGKAKKGAVFENHAGNFSVIFCQILFQWNRLPWPSVGIPVSKTSFLVLFYVFGMRKIRWLRKVPMVQASWTSSYIAARLVTCFFRSNMARRWQYTLLNLFCSVRTWVAKLWQMILRWAQHITINTCGQAARANLNTIAVWSRESRNAPGPVWNPTNTWTSVKNPA